MARYIDADKLIDKIFPIGLIDDGKYAINAKAIKMAIDSCPTVDVVPKSEVYRLERLRSELSKEVADLQDALKCEKETNAHLCEEYMSAMREVEAMQRSFGEKLEVAEALISTLNKTTNNAKQEVARKIFEEIEKIIERCKYTEEFVFPNTTRTRYNGERIFDMLAELKKKYTEGKYEN